MPRVTCVRESRSHAAASRTTSSSAGSVTWLSCASARGVSRPAQTSPSRPLLSPRPVNGSAFPSRRPRCSRLAGLSTCGAIPRRSRRSGAPRMQRGRRATFRSASRSRRSRPSRNSTPATARGARWRRCGARSTKSATGGRHERWSSSSAASRRACSWPRASVTRQSRSRAPSRTAQRVVQSRRARPSPTPTLPARSSCSTRTSRTARP